MISQINAVRLMETSLVLLKEVSGFCGVLEALFKKALDPTTPGAIELKKNLDKVYDASVHALAYAELCSDEHYNAHTQKVSNG